jgi:hypothetical protein
LSAKAFDARRQPKEVSNTGHRVAVALFVSTLPLSPDAERGESMSPNNAKPDPSGSARFFDCFPYVVTRIVPSLYHIILLPMEWGPDHLYGFAQRQWQANRLPTNIVILPNACVYFDSDGDHFSDAIPAGGTVISAKLHPVEEVPVTDHIVTRTRLLELFVAEQHPGGGAVIRLGDLTKGGRLPSPDEEARLRGTDQDGIPKGLARCPACQEWKGTCFDTLIPQFIVRVSCRCENDNVCARCDGLLGERRLNSNHYNPVDGKVWHVPGLVALEHRCVQS